MKDQVERINHVDKKPKRLTQVVDVSFERPPLDSSLVWFRGAAGSFKWYGSEDDVVKLWRKVKKNE
jgi:hypothetical protein